MSLDPFDGKAEWFDRHYEDVRSRVRFRVLRQQFKEALPPPPAAILDAGGGPGRFSAALATDGYAVMLLDPSEEMLARAEKALSGHRDARVVKGKAQEAPGRGFSSPPAGGGIHRGGSASAEEQGLPHPTPSLPGRRPLLQAPIFPNRDARPV